MDPEDGSNNLIRNVDNCCNIRLNIVSEETSLLQHCCENVKSRNIQLVIRKRQMH